MYLEQEMLMIETPGNSGRFKARIVAIIRFDECFQYKNSREFYRDVKRHCVTPDSPWAWNDEKPKWGWRVIILERFSVNPKIKKRLGIRFTLDIGL